MRRHVVRYRQTTGKIMQHLVIAARALGRPLPAGVQVHHVNGDGRDNSRGNLVICQSQAYHMWLHMRQLALDECGHANWRKCRFCKTYSDPSRMEVKCVSGGSAGVAYHQACNSDYGRRRRERIRAQC